MRDRQKMVDIKWAILRHLPSITIKSYCTHAHPELLKSERILDLEDQVKSLVAQVRKLDVEKEEMWGRLRN